jgi:stage III sporulation protein AG
VSERNRLFSFWQKGKADKPLKWIAIVLGGGIALMALGDLQKEDPPKNDERTDKPSAAEVDVKSEYERELTAALNQIAGTGHVSVVVNLASSERKVLEKNTSSSTADGDVTKEEQVAIVRNGDAENPVILEVRKPDIQGVLVVADGVQNVHVKKRIMEAVTRMLGVPVHRVAVMPGKTEETK